MHDSKQNIKVLLERLSKRLAELHTRSQRIHQRVAGLPHQDSLRQARETLGNAREAFAVNDFRKMEGHLIEVTIHLDTAERLLKSLDQRSIP